MNTKAKQKNTISWKTEHFDYYYSVAAGIPAALFLLIKLLYIVLQGTCLPTFLPYSTLPFLMLAGISFYFLIKHSKTISLTNPAVIFIFVTAYSCSSYAMLQEVSITSLLLYAIFPIIFYYFENMILRDRFIPFVIACTVMLYINPEAGIPISLLLFVLSIIALIYMHQFKLGNLLHIIGLFLFSFGLAAVRIVFYIAPYIAEHTDYSYEGFSLSYSPAIFLGRFLPGVAASRAMIGTDNRLDLYFGLLPLIFFMLYFTNRSICLRKKVCAEIFTLIIFSVLEFSPVLYVFNLFQNTTHVSLSISFFLVFWMLYLGMHSATNLSILSRLELLLSYAILLVSIAIVWLWSGHNYSKIMILVHFGLLSLYFAFLLIRYNTSKKNIFVLLALLIFEISMNGYFCTNKSLYPNNTSIHQTFAFQEYINTNTQFDTSHVSFSNKKDEKKYNDFVTKYTDSKALDTLNNFYKILSLSDKEKERYCNTPFPDTFEELNGLCKKAGIPGTLFTKVDYTLNFNNSKRYQIENEGYDIYNVSSLRSTALPNCIISFKIKQPSASITEPVYMFDNVSGKCIKLDKKLKSGKECGYISVSMSENSSLNMQILFYKLNQNTYKQLTSYVNTHTQDSASAPVSYLKYDYIGIGISLAFFFFMVIFLLYDHKEEMFNHLFSFKTKLNISSKMTYLGSTLFHARIYLLSFFIPFTLYIIGMIINDASPFGTNTLFDSDGVWSSIPTFLDHYYKYYSKNTFLTMNIGYGSDLSLSYTIHLLSKFYHFLPLNLVVPAMEFMLATTLGLCGLNMTIYMTHRRKRTAVSPQDIRLLLPSTIYAINAYALASHCYPTWYFVLLLFPLIILSMDNLLLNRHTIGIGYSIMLGLAIFLDIQLAMFVCIYLVIHFFTYRFTSISDFIKKGVRFTMASLLAGGCGFLSVYRTLTAYQSSGYTSNDNIFPSFGLHGSFWEQWRKLLIFTPTDAVNANEGNVSLYCGIFTLILLLTYFIYKKEKLADKLRYLFPILLLLVSFNGQVLSYLWNGLHYQSNCPNRYVFLLCFLFAELSYEGIIILPTLSCFRMQIVTLLAGVFMLLCFTFSETQSNLALLASLACLLVYYTTHCVFSCKHLHSLRYYYYAFVTFALIELSANMLYTTTTWDSTAISSLGDYVSISKQLSSSSFKNNDEYFRTSFVGSRKYNMGQYYNTGSLNGFGTCINEAQLKLQNSYGFNITANGMDTEYTSTPLNMSLADCKYIFLPVYSAHSIQDLEHYQYIGIMQNNYVFENTNALSLGFYYPQDALVSSKIQSVNPLYWNKLLQIYTNSADTIYDFDTLKYTESRNISNSYYFTNSNGDIISRKEAKKIVNHLETQVPMSSQVKIHINYNAPNAGNYYLYVNSLVSLGKLRKGPSCNTVGLVNTFLLDSTALNIVYYHEDTPNRLISVLKENELTNVSINHDTITGTTSYSDTGYTLFSLAYSKNWHAYIDGKEVETLNPYNSNLMIKTPAGKHKITLKFVPQYLRECQIVTLCFWLLCCILYVVPNIYIKIRRKYFRI